MTTLESLYSSMPEDAPARPTGPKGGSMTKNVIKRLRRFRACSNAVAWANKFDSDQAAWDACERADWMLWIASRLSWERGSEEHRKVVLAACACARMALEYVPAKEKRPLEAILLAERYGRGENIGPDDLRAAAYASYAAGYAADADARAAAGAAYAVAVYAVYAANAVSAASYAANAAAAIAATDAVAVYAAYAASEAASAAAIAAGYAASAAATAADAFGNERTKALAKMAKVIRKIIPKAPKE